MVGTTRQGRSIEEELTDALAWDARLSGCHIEAQLVEGIATLSGFVELPSQKLIAVDIASRIKGVSRVVDDLVVRPSETRTDQEMAADVCLSLKQDIRVDEKDIIVSVSGGFVTLSGTVRSQEESRAAVEDVWTIKGVKSVINNIRVLPPQVRAEEAIEQRILAFIGGERRVLDPTRISVRCRDGVVYLRGAVSSPGERRVVEDYVRSIEGVDKVRNELAVEPVGNE